MKIKNYGYNRQGHSAKLGIYLSDNELKKLREKGHNYCSEELLTAYYPLQTEVGQSIRLETRKNRLHMRIIYREPLIPKGWLIEVRIQDNQGDYSVPIVTKNKPTPSQLTMAIIRKLVKNGEVAKLY